MATFKIGQKAVIAVKDPTMPGYEHNGKVVTVLSELMHFSYWNKPSYKIDFAPPPYDGYAAYDALEPLIEKGDYERFMERVLKPVDLGQPVTA
jgi:hypothetical protein